MDSDDERPMASTRDKRSRSDTSDSSKHKSAKQRQHLVVPACWGQFWGSKFGGDATLRLYEEALRDSKAWHRWNAGTVDLQTSDKAVERCFDFLFFDGCGLWEGRTQLYGLPFVFNVSFKLATLIERSKRAFEEWARMQPSRSRDLVPILGF